VTQILAALTHEYVVVASDRKLTFSSGPRRGQTADDNTCKLVSLCGVWGIAYTGFSQLEGIPTHEWIAIRLAEKGCTNGSAAAEILSVVAPAAMKAAPFRQELTFLIAGWMISPDRRTLQPHFLLVSNVSGIGAARPPGLEFLIFQRVLGPKEAVAGQLIGHPLRPSRGKSLGRALRRMIKHGLGPKPAMEALVNEVINSSGATSSVGEKVLAFSISKKAAEHTLRSGQSMILAALPDKTNAAFCYFDSGYSELRQYGPTSVCGQSAVTDLETENDHSRDYQSSSVRILYLPPKNK
jgi:hypothetical protein